MAFLGNQISSFSLRVRWPYRDWLGGWYDRRGRREICGKGCKRHLMNNIRMYYYCMYICTLLIILQYIYVSYLLLIISIITHHNYICQINWYLPCISPIMHNLLRDKSYSILFSSINFGFLSYFTSALKDWIFILCIIIQCTRNYEYKIKILLINCFHLACIGMAPFNLPYIYVCVCVWMYICMYVCWM